MKVGREEIVGLLVALRRFATGSDADDLERMLRLLDPIELALDGMPGISVSRSLSTTKPIPALRIELTGAHAGERAYAVVNALLEGEPSIAIDQSQAEFGRLSVLPQGITAEEAVHIARRLQETLRDA